MEYKEFRVTVVDDKNVWVTLPSGHHLIGSIQDDHLKRETLKIFNKWLAQGSITDRKELIVFGSYLYQVLFNGEIDTKFKNTYDEILKQPDTYLRLVLEFEQEARELANLPWEYIYYPDTPRERGFQIATKSKLILARQVPLNVPEDHLKPRERQLHILITVSQPKDLKKVLADPVIAAIEELKNKLPGTIEVHQLKQPDTRTFPEKINSIKPHVLHFIGHGRWDKENKSGQLAFVNKEDNSALWIDDQDFSDYFQDFQPRLVFLHACEGASSESYEGFKGLALQLVYSKVPGVVAMQYEISNKVAIEFAKKFYECLGEGKPIDVAVQEGRLELGMYLEPKHFSSRAFGSPVVFLQFLKSPEGIIIIKQTETEQTIPQKIILTKCPNCGKDIEPGQIYCYGDVGRPCGHDIGNCPKCGRLMSLTIGRCRFCPPEPSKAETKKEDSKKLKKTQGIETIDRKKGIPQASVAKSESSKIHSSTQARRQLAGVSGAVRPKH